MATPLCAVFGVSVLVRLTLSAGFGRRADRRGTSRTPRSVTMRWSLEHDVVRPAPAPRAGLEQPALKIGDLELNVDVRPGNGSGRPLLVCNGIGASLHILDPLVDALDPT